MSPIQRRKSKDDFRLRAAAGDAVGCPSMGEVGKTQGKDLTMSLLSLDQTLEGARQSPASCRLLPSSLTRAWVPAKERAPGRTRWVVAA